MPDSSHPDHSLHHEAPADWQSALSALPLESAPADSWHAITTRLRADHHSNTHGRRRLTWRLAIAASVAMAVAGTWQMLPRNRTGADTGTPTSIMHADTGVVVTEPVAGQRASDIGATVTLETLYAESARLEALLDIARDSRVSSASAAVVSEELESRVAGIDTALMQPGLSIQQQTALWRQRVAALRAVTGFESTRRWLASNGERYDGVLMRVD